MVGSSGPFPRLRWRLRYKYITWHGWISCSWTVVQAFYVPSLLGPCSGRVHPIMLVHGSFCPILLKAHMHTGEKLDPRAAVAGRSASPAGEPWASGLFDRGSWIECQAGWARSVVTGRARLGGVPVGVIAVETQTVMLNIPADPGAPDSSERIIPQVICLP